MKRIIEKIFEIKLTNRIKCRFMCTIKAGNASKENNCVRGMVFSIDIIRSSIVLNQLKFVENRIDLCSFIHICLQSLANKNPSNREIFWMSPNISFFIFPPRYSSRKIE